MMPSSPSSWRQEEGGVPRKEAAPRAQRPGGGRARRQYTRCRELRGESMQGKSPELLGELAERMGYDYLSDLRCRPKGADWEELARLVASTPTGSFPAVEWDRALDYLVGEEPRHDVREARALLAERLRAQGRPTEDVAPEGGLVARIAKYVARGKRQGRKERS